MSASFAWRSRGAVVGLARSWRVSCSRARLCQPVLAKLRHAGLHTAAMVRGTILAERSMSCSAGEKVAAASASSSTARGGDQGRTGGLPGKRGPGRAASELDRRAEWNEGPKAWEDAAREIPWYTPEDIMAWRAEFGFARRQHSMAQFGYTDDELLEWRAPFDELATDEGISFPKFERFVCRKYKDVIPDAQLAAKVQYFWEKFDRDRSNHIDFGEFIIVGLAFDIAWAKEKIRKEGIEETFMKYAENDFMIEPHFFQLMCDFRFFVSTATDVRKLVLLADQDRDGLVSLADFVTWAESPDFDMMHGTPKSKRHRKGGGEGEGREKRPPPQPEPE